MSPRFDHAAVERAAAGLGLRLPRGPFRGKVGDARAASVGSSLELHDFRGYHPGDDLRQIDWNAVARTGELIVRVRQDEVMPRVEVLLDASGSMAVSPAKEARAKEVAAWVCTLARHAGLEVRLLVVGRADPGAPAHAEGHAATALAAAAPFTAPQPFPLALDLAPPLRPCGVRVVVSDFLFEADPQPLVERLARGASACHLVQLLDEEDLAPTGGAGARLTDAETGETLERLLTDEVLARYARRLQQHVALWQAAARRAGAQWLQASAEHPLDALARRPLAPLVDWGTVGP